MNFVTDTVLCWAFLVAFAGVRVPPSQNRRMEVALLVDAYKIMFIKLLRCWKISVSHCVSS